MTDGADAELRAKVREFVRTHHPDRGGDPHVFAAGLKALRESRERRAAADVSFYRSHTGPRAAVAWAQRRWERARRPPRVQ